MAETALTRDASWPIQVAILAGGLGVRLRPLTLTVPKPMTPVRGRPFLEHQLDLIRRQGVERVLLLVGYLYDVIERHFEDGRRFGLRIQYSREASPMGTAGALRQAGDLLEDRWLLLNGDTYLDADYAAMAGRFDRATCEVLMAVYGNEDRIAANNVRLGPGGRVECYDKRQADKATHVDAGAYVFRKQALQHIPPGRPASLEGDLFPDLARDGGLAGYPVTRRYYDIGTFERLSAAEQALR